MHSILSATCFGVPPALDLHTEVTQGYSTMQKLVWIFTLTVLLFAFQDAAFSQDDSMFRLRCSLNKGDTVDKVKKFYNISSDPKKWDRPTPGGTAYQYHFPEYGVWVFLNPNLQISSLRFDRPFAGKIGDVAIGDTKDDVLRIKGKPGSESDGLPDQEVMEKRGKLKWRYSRRLA